jgi:hypothetical protein
LAEIVTTHVPLGDRAGTPIRRPMGNAAGLAARIGG